MRKKTTKPKIAAPAPTTELEDAINAAKKSGRYMVAVWYVDASGTQINLHRTTRNYSTADFDTSVKLLADELQRERDKQGEL